MDLDITIEIFNMAGGKVKELKVSLSPIGYTSTPIFWDGKDENGNKIRQGIYIYRILLRSLRGSVLSKAQKMIIMN
jgi:flagellar hook assembly protein FlgD